MARVLGSVALYLAVMTPVFVATIQRPPWRAIDWTRPAPGTTSPTETSITPLRPCSIATPSITSRTVQSAILLGSAGACGFADVCRLGAAAEAWTGLGDGMTLVAAAGACGGADAAGTLRSMRPKRSVN